MGTNIPKGPGNKEVVNKSLQIIHLSDSSMCILNFSHNVLFVTYVPFFDFTYIQEYHGPISH